MPPIRGLWGSIIGLLGSGVGLGSVFAQSATDATQPWVPIISGSGAATAVAAIVYIARLMANGRLVARDPDAVEKQLLQINASLAKLVETGQKREEDYLGFLRGSRQERER